MTEIDIFNGNAIVQDIAIVVLTILAIQVFIMINDLIKSKELLSATVTRKFIHIVAAPIYIFMWTLYSGDSNSKYISLIVPGIFAIQFILIGVGIIKNEAFVKTMSRSGDPKELLRGTLFYAIMMMVAALFYFIALPLEEDQSPVAVVAIMALAFGDGFADIVGRSMDTMKFKVFSEKSIPGSLAMLIASLVGSFAGLAIFGFDLGEYTGVTIVACIVATIIEAVSPKETDNVTIPLIVILIFQIY